MLTKTTTTLNPTNNRPMLTIAKGQSVYAPTLITHPIQRTLVALQMLGPEQAVKANWAALMNNNRASYYLHGSYTVVDGSKEHVTLKKMLPCGWLEMWLIHKQASYQTITPAAKTVYFITTSEQPETAVFHTFYLTLNKLLATPILPAWSQYLWYRGLEYSHITPIPPSDCTGPYTAHVINPREPFWQQRIKEGLANGEISLTP